MSNLAFGTYAQVKQLVQTGVPEAQAEAIINAVAGTTSFPDISQLATKADLALVEAKVALVEANMRGEIKGLKGELIWWIVGCFGLNACISLGAALPQLLAHLPK